MPSSDSAVDEMLQTDLLVIGAGVSGYCAAIQAARAGCDVVLLEKDEVLGGNSGPNCGVHITGADRYHHYSSETGLIAELSEQQAWCRAQTQVSPGTLNCNISRRWEAVVQTTLEAAGVRVLKRHYATSPIVERGRIVAVVVEDLAAFRTKRIEVRHCVVEASGDGEVGVRAGAGYRYGREARREHDERSAPLEADRLVQGTSLMAIAQNAHRPIEFIPPPGLPPYQARLWFHQPGDGWHERTFREDRDLIFLYLTETGGNRDTIRDDAAIYEDLLKQLWAEWDHIKNGPHAEDARTWDLAWVSPKAGKRESRRLLGDVILTQNDLETGRHFPDAVAYGGFDIDIHEPHGDTADIVSYSIPPLYSIPLRCLFSKDVENLLLAGRLVSTTHMAHASVRVMRTGAVIGQAVGMAAALCKAHGCTPRGLAQRHVDELQQRLLRADATILHVPNQDDADLARTARVEATSHETFNDQRPATFLPLDGLRGLVLYDWPTSLRRVEVYLRNEGAEARRVAASLQRARPERRWKPHAEFTAHRWRDLRLERFDTVADTTIDVPGNFEGWLPLPLADNLELTEKEPTSEEDRLLIALGPCDGVSWARADRPCEIVAVVERDEADPAWRFTSDGSSEGAKVEYPDPNMPPKCEPPGKRLLVRLDPAPPVGEATNVVNGYARRFSTAPANLWIARRGEPLPQSLTLEFPTAVTFDTVQLTFDTIYDDYHDMPHNYGPRAAGMCVKDYRLEVRQGDRWREVTAAQDNYHRFRVHRFDPVTTASLRLTVSAIHDPARYTARVYEIRVYHNGE